MPHSHETLPAVADSHRMLETLLGNLPGLVYRCRNDANWTAEFFSAGTLALTGFLADDFIARRRHYAEVIHPDDRARVWDAVQAALARGERFVIGYRIITADGSTRWVQEQGCGVQSSQGALEALEGFVTDVTDAHVSELARTENEHRLETLFQSMPVAAWEEDFSAVRDFLAMHELLGQDATAVRAALARQPSILAECVTRVRVLDVNSEAVRMHRARDRDELLAGLDRIVAAESHDALVRQLVAIATRQRSFECDTRVRTFDGEIRDVHLCWSVTPGCEESLRRVIVTTMDVTDRRRAQDEAALLQSIARGIGEAATENEAIDFLLRHVCQAAGWNLGEAWTPAPDGQVLVWSCGWSDATPDLLSFQQVSRETRFTAGVGLPGSVWTAIQPVWIEDVGTASNFPRRDAAVRAGLKAALGVPVLAHDEVVLVLGFFLAERRAHDRHFVSVISAAAAQIGMLIERKRASDALAREAAARRHAESAMRLQASALNAAANAIMITDREGVIECVNPAWSRLTGYTAEEAIGKTPRILKSGRQDPKFYEQFWQAVLAGRTVNGELVNRRKDGTFYHEHETITPITDADGRVTHFIAIKQDISERLALEEQLRQSQKMDAIGQLAGGVAHDFNNLLTVIRGNTEIAQIADVPADERAEALAEISRASERAASLTRQLLAFGRRQVIQPRTVDLNEAVTAVTRMLQRLIGEDIRLQIFLHPSPVFIRADPGMLDQVLMNLAVNARDAMAGGGTLTLSTALTTIGDEDRRRRPELTSGTYASLRVADTGCGIPEQNLPHIFEPFFTTKGPGRGTGLGLATVFGIVKQHAGVIRVDSAEGVGTTFEIALPLDDIAPAPDSPAPASPHRKGLGETILVVEDDGAVRRLAVRILQAHGYRVLEADDGPAALQAAATQGRIDLLITDMIMPGGLTGQELADRLRAQRPDLRVIFMSGYTGDRMRSDQLIQEGFNFLPKPFSAEDLARCVRARLDLTP